MSPTRKGRAAAKPVAVTLPSTSVPVLIDGRKFTMQLDDAAMLREVMDTARRMRSFDASAADDDQADSIVGMGEAAKRAIDMALGDGSHALIFGEGHLPIFRAAVVLSVLNDVAGPSYDKMMAAYLPKD